MILKTVLLWLLSLAAYLLLAGQVGGSEIAVGVVLANASTGWYLMLRDSSGRRFTLTAADARAWLRAVGKLVPATLRTGAVLARVAMFGGSPGTARRVPFVDGVLDDPLERARRATAILAASLGPDSFVVRADHGRGEVLVHGIVAGASEPDRLWLV